MQNSNGTGIRPPVEQFLDTEGFGPPDVVQGRSSIADLFPKSRRTGLYVLEFADEWRYVGLSRNVVRRFAQHAKRWQDIVRIRVRRAPIRDLKRLESELIPKIENACTRRVRNLAEASLAPFVADLDDIIDPDSQSKWLQEPTSITLTRRRAKDDALRSRLRERWQAWTNDELHTEVTECARRYVQKTIIDPRATEMAFWSATLLPPDALIRINVFWQETFFCERDDDGTVVYWVSFAPSALTPCTRVRYRAWRRANPSAEVISTRSWKSGGQDQRQLLVSDSGTLLALLADDEITKAMRVFNLRLMRKGGCPRSRSQSHCLDLADALVRPS